MAKLKIDKVNSDKSLIQVQVDSRMKRRLKDISDEKNLPMRTIVKHAIDDYIDRVDFDHSAPDYVLDRLNQLFVSNMELIKEVQRLREQIESGE